ncbi:NAD-dependent epimerase/dehydratase family protein [Paenibacillus sp. ACRRX]|uniref:NAD-dependent epimerase/dehydratase family protein n=1 Tax=Paenibacillus sp. ACRRX TaxID=2918206 RepID=UPI001EF476EA|nr:NAD-dependent epimerase/dehydratase family protein [Paenibacillus sp. ACRRX]MCG7410248.1 NAD-dependent epimerase/dehydratase family protein [Paenibacillus sp. ACRRX]
MTKDTALVLGATGLVGSELMARIHTYYKRVIVLSRRPVIVPFPNVEVHTIDFDRIDQYAALFQAEDVFCCLGTTIKQAKSKEAFRKVDYIYPLQAGKLSAAAQVRSFTIITAMGSSPKSAFFYSRVKGDLETGLQALPLRALHIVRPSLIIGARQEFRLGERAAAAISPLLSPILRGPLLKYRPIQASIIAEAMLYAASSGLGGTHIYPSDQLCSMAAQLNK